MFPTNDIHVCCSYTVGKARKLTNFSMMCGYFTFDTQR